ncbi:S-adenosylhomocysteine deaminase/methtylthioadenosine deaminase [Mucinivorans hirudinis]|uniref:S-adenosylhomocysteine deaminase/methtylthioadenosine deaminase n=1 Tax=Mucinivorans hirudinis TaxID=1433126 RepID=A0A060R7F2_9BACT|nr:S-adenosylhomocysteine deaminase/methtylthioadenosine deaminase [Mucinivorans hirudinis]
MEFNEAAEVVGVEYNVADIDSLPSTRYYNGILIPGMVNAHCHLELSFYEDVIPKHTGLIGFIKQVVSQRGNFTPEQKKRAIAKADDFMWGEGIQAVGDISNDATSFETKVGSKIYYHTFAEYFGMVIHESCEEFYSRQTAHIATGHEMGLTVTPTSHSTYLVSEGLFKKANLSQRLSIHFMETPAELELFQSRGQMYEFLVQSDMTPDFLNYGSHSVRLVESVDGRIPTLLIHNTNIEREDVERIVGHFGEVTFVLCPRSNHYIEKAYPPAEMLWQMGVNVALGTDSLASNDSLSMVEEVKWLARANPNIPLEVMLGWATRGGASALGISQEIGSFEVGKKPGAVLLTDIDFHKRELTPQTRASRVL